jgi:thiamine pyrophosphate-dependent acetolactate synthase large subunit-like protein
VSAPLDRRVVVGALMAADPDALVVAGLGSTAWDVTAIGDRALTLPLWGAMGGAAMAGLGLALAQPGRRVLVVTGDGEMLMGLGALATIAVQAPQNLAVAVIDNEHYGETGMQPTHTGRGADLAAMARGAGWSRVHAVADEAGLAALCGALGAADGPLFAAVKTGTGPQKLVLPPRDGAHLTHRLRAALGVEGD